MRLSSLIFRELSVSSSSESRSVFVLVLSLSPNYILINVLVLVLVLATKVSVFSPVIRPNFRKGTNRLSSTSKAGSLSLHAVMLKTSGQSCFEIASCMPQFLLVTFH